MPARVPVPLPLFVNVIPDGSGPVAVTDASGKPDVVIVKVRATPIPKDADVALVTAGAWLTLRTKLWAAGVPTPLVALSVRR